MPLRSKPTTSRGTAGDPRAAANFDLVAAAYAGLALDPEAPIAWFTEKDGGDGAVVRSFVARGDARAAGTGSGTTNTGALLGLPELESFGDGRVRKVFDDQFMVANERWLETLSDVPGEYLAARISHERKRREDLGLLQPPPEDPRMRRLAVLLFVCGLRSPARKAARYIPAN